MRPLARSDDQAAFWRGHVRTAVCVALAVGAATLLYALATLSGPNRGLILAVAAPAAIAAPVALWLIPVEPIVRAPLGALYFYAWELFGVAIVGLLAYWDGGATSPLSLFLFVLLVHAATAYPLSGTVMVVAVISGTYSWLALVSGWPAARAVTAALAVAATGLVGAHSAANHLRARDREARLRRALNRQAQRDGLTGCLNHQAFHAALSEAAAAASPERPLALLVIDVDQFKHINDTAGHLVGDAHLQELGATLRSGTRQSDLVGRIGGDEFAVALPDSDLVRARQTAGRIRNAAKANQRPLTVSIGVVVVAQPSTASAVFAAADQALYEAKDSGRDQVSVAVAVPPSSHQATAR